MVALCDQSGLNSEKPEKQGVYAKSLGMLQVLLNCSTAVFQIVSV